MKYATRRPSSSAPTPAGKYWRVIPLICSIVFALLLVTNASALPNFVVTKLDTLIGGDGDGQADPGETIQYTIPIQNSGPDPATGVVYDDTIDPNTTLIAGSLECLAVGSQRYL